MRKTLIAILIVLFVINALMAFTRPHNEPGTLVYTVCKGDTLWSVASKYKPYESDIRKCVYSVEKINHIGADIQPGQTIIVPLSD